MTFNLGCNKSVNKLEEFDDVRIIQQYLNKKGETLESEADKKISDPASFVF